VTAAESRTVARRFLVLPHFLAVPKASPLEATVNALGPDPDRAARGDAC
jgi:hypothetical protein